ncbi:MAG TPA: ShlB/FhaC/HecB family hemolysin secretion/activation protein [Rhodocyclaceae bacterium]|nr:ShlB/FhaC/HecB family hemolysin secretion/activation protein [Rhodocyclaceae bacterium]
MHRSGRVARFPFLLSLPGAVLALCCVPAVAAPPDAGTLLQEIRPLPPSPPGAGDVLPQEAPRPAAQLDDTVPVTVRGFRIQGARAFSDSELQALLASGVGQQLTLAKIHALAQNLTRHYREAGYPLARAYLPAQEIREGIVEVAILEGRLGRRSVRNQSRLDERRVAAYLDDLREGDAVRGEVLERDLLLLADLPGVDVRSTLKPGASVGTTDLDIRLTDRSPYGGTLELDNFGNRNTGVWRLGSSFNAGNLAGLADSLALRALRAQGMDYVRIGWQLPVGSAGTQAGAAWSQMHYSLGKDFASLEAHGVADIASLYLLHPFVRSRLANLNGQFQYEHKELDDDIDSTAIHNRKALDVWTLGLSGSRLDGVLGGGNNQASLSYVLGQLHLDAVSLGLDQMGHQSAGHYGKWNLSASRQQRLADDWSVSAGLHAQWAGKNLDSSEKMSLGGPQGVRAYPSGEANCDDAWQANLELRYRLLGNVQASLFYDAAQGRINHEPIAADGNNHRRLAGHGLGLAYADADLQVQAFVTWRDTAAPTAGEDRNPRVWIQAVTRF